MLSKRFVLFGLALSMALGNSVVLSASESTELVSEKKEEAAKSTLGPPNTDFNSPGFKITKVVRIERNLNALGIAGQFGKTNKVGKYVELPKRLEPSERGEHFVITWKYSPKGDGSSPEQVRLVFEYKLSNEEHLETIIREYSNLRKGTYRLQVENTGSSYQRRGYIEYWCARVLADGKSAARKESFLWPVFQPKADSSPGEAR
ncbi:MAG: hypothetical protein Q8Q12_11525 [bacterium]|nr:hypothetical protein [bacterium]